MLIALTAALFFRKDEPTSLDYFLEQKIPTLLEKAEPKKIVDVTTIIAASRPSELSNVDLFLPHYHLYDFAEIKSLFDYSSTCTNLPIKIADGSTQLKKAWTWVKWTCQSFPLSADFFKRPPYL